MNKATFFEFVRNPGLLSGETLADLMDIVDEYPWFQAGRALLVKNLSDLDHVRYNSELKQAAAYIPDRGRLFELVNTDFTVEEEAPPVDESLDGVVADLLETKGNVVSENVEIAQVEQVEEVIKEDVIEVSRPSLQVTSSIDSVSDYFQVDDVFETSSGKEIDFSIVGKEEAAVGGIDNMVLPSADFLGYESMTVTGYQLEGTIDLNEASEENRSFSDWLNVLRHAPKLAEEDKPEPAKKKQQLIDSFLSIKSPKIASKKSSVEKLIKPEKTVEKTVERSEDTDELMSETLASIYIKQKQYPKAIAIFEKLLLKYPEKNVYFADRISELEKLINNQ